MWAEVNSEIQSDAIEVISEQQSVLSQKSDQQRNFDDINEIRSSQSIELLTNKVLWKELHIHEGFPIFSKPSSEIITSYKSGDIIKKWEDISMLILHENIRFYSQLFNDGILNSKSFTAYNNSRWKFAYFFEVWTQYYYPTIIQYNDIMKNVIIPYLKSIASDVNIEDNSGSLFKLGNKINEMYTMWRGSMHGSIHDVNIHDMYNGLIQILTQFLNVLRDQVNRYEYKIPEILKDNEVTFQQWNENVITQIIEYSQQFMNCSLPGIIYVMYSWAGEEDAMYFLNKLRDTSRILFDTLWLNRWRQDCLAKMIAVINNDETIIHEIKDKNACCCIIL